ncbi:MAG TPA: hypothetical protein VFV38_13850, partial [Ktedonobacteraceae bacterium]|nr:hypothetical protein [Ktedonobacteraceae bacterium]
DRVFMCMGGIFLLGGGIFLLIPGENVHVTLGELLFSILLIGLAVLFLLPSIIALVMMLKGNNSRLTRVVRITTEGVFFVHLFPTVVAWSEISRLVLYMQPYLGNHHAVLSILPRDPEAILARILEKRSGNVFTRLFTKITVFFYRRSNALSPLSIPQAVLSIPLDDFLAMIQERFADELGEHGVTVLGWQR